MLDVEDFNSVFQGVGYSDGAVQQIQSYRQALGGKTFFERLLELLKIQGKKLYPPRSDNQLKELHQQIVNSETTLHNKHCLIFYLLKDLSPHQHETTELASKFARDVHLEKRFWTFIEGLWALDHLEFRIAVENLTHPSIIPTFPDEIMYTLLKGSDKIGALGAQEDKQDDILPLAYYNCVKPPLEDARTRNEFAKYFVSRNVTEAYHWIHTRPEHEQKGLLELMIEQTLHSRTWSTDEGMYTPEEMALEFVSLPFSEEEEEFIEKFLTEGKGRSYQGAQDTVLMRRIAMGRLADVAGEVGVRGRKHDGVNWEILKDGVAQGLGPRKEEEESFRV